MRFVSTPLNPIIPIGGQLVETILTHLPLSRRQAEDHAVQLLAEDIRTASAQVAKFAPAASQFAANRAPRTP